MNKRMQAMAELGFIASGLAHDLRSPLSVITTYAQLMAGASSEEQRAHYLQSLMDSAANLNGLLEVLADVARPETNKSGLGPVVEATPHALAEELEIYKELFAARDGLEQSIELHIESNGESAPLYKRSALRILGNAIENAASALVQTQDPKIWVHIESNHELPAHQATQGQESIGWRLVVADNGPGMSQALNDFLNQSGTVAQSAPTQAGLGVYIMRWLVVHLGGSLRIGQKNIRANTELDIWIPHPAAR